VDSSIQGGEVGVIAVDHFFAELNHDRSITVLP